jgi:glycosyltransferase involved in cell wall biosynthesis
VYALERLRRSRAEQSVDFCRHADRIESFNDEIAMPRPRGIRYYGAADLSGYGQASIAYVRGLVNAGVPVQWIPLDWAPERMQVGTWSRRLMQQHGNDGWLADLPTLIQRTSAPLDYDTVIAHAPPEFWPFAFEPGKRNIGYAAWETDRAPAHWLPLLRQADRVLVPCAQNRDAFVRSGLSKPIEIVPHIRRHRWCEYSPSDIDAARQDLGIPSDHRVFYTINAWDPRKALPDLIAAFAMAFDESDRVALVIKTQATGHAPGPLYQRMATRALATQAISEIAATLQRAAPLIVLLDEELDADAIDLIHAVGDVFVSLSRGEGFGLGAFEAATLGKPVIMTGWGGHRDFLGDDWPGAVPYRFAPVPLWPPDRPSYFPSQRWAESDRAAAARLMREAFDNPSPMHIAAQRIRERIVERYAEPVVMAQLLDAIG